MYKMFTSPPQKNDTYKHQRKHNKKSFNKFENKSYEKILGLP